MYEDMMRVGARARAGVINKERKNKIAICEFPLDVPQKTSAR